MLLTFMYIEDIIQLLSLFSAFSFIFFGISCLFSTYMKSEFKRYGLKHYQKLVGTLQILGALGLFLGQWLSLSVQGLAALGLSILMFLGFLTRLKIRDSLLQSSSSLFYAVLNAIIVIFILNEQFSLF
ncbi:MAG: DoxX family protein [Flavobacteriaceae bacterium]|nr:DoxX family protein [Flavobacteriaceae bacterium]MDG2350168.1 DoxX family protein [Flavobacteriaceae bacterium]